MTATYGLLSTDHVMGRVVADLTAKFSGIFAAETVERYVYETYTALGRTSKVKAHLPVLTARFAADGLTALAQAKGAIPTLVPEVLFVCVHNAGRSQMAAALLEHHAAGTVHVRSAGSMPTADLQPTVVQVMAEIGIPLTDAYPKPLTDDVVRAADVVITMGCGDACPVYAGKRYLDWDLNDPAGSSIDAVRRIRDDINARVVELLNELVGTAAHLPRRSR